MRRDQYKRFPLYFLQCLLLLFIVFAKPISASQLQSADRRSAAERDVQESQDRMMNDIHTDESDSAPSITMIRKYGEPMGIKAVLGEDDASHDRHGLQQEQQRWRWQRRRRRSLQGGDEYPTNLPSSVPSRVPSSFPLSLPSSIPTTVPTPGPSEVPSSLPTGVPSTTPSSSPTLVPSCVPTNTPSTIPTIVPLSLPSNVPTFLPTGIPSTSPTNVPSTAPTWIPSSQPSNVPSSIPTSTPTSPSNIPTCIPSCVPSAIPSLIPSGTPSTVPSTSPSLTPSSIPTLQPSSVPSEVPSNVPTLVPTSQPTVIPTSLPSSRPTSSEPSSLPTLYPSKAPSSLPTLTPTLLPSCVPTMAPSSTPTTLPSNFPSSSPSSMPTSVPTGAPSSSCPTSSPSSGPSCIPTQIPTLPPTSIPSITPTTQPTTVPSGMPITLPTVVPSSVPTSVPTGAPSSSCPTSSPSSGPSCIPTQIPTLPPTSIPSMIPTTQPTAVPSGVPSFAPSNIPTSMPTSLPSGTPTSHPTVVPSSLPTKIPTTSQPTSAPTICPTVIPSSTPTGIPSACPSIVPTELPTLAPSCQPTNTPTSVPSNIPTWMPTSQPSMVPTLTPTTLPTMIPTSLPSNAPSFLPSNLPTSVPSSNPTSIPTLTPSAIPSAVPSSNPTNIPTIVPSSQPTVPTSQPSGFPTGLPTSQPSSQPSQQPTTQPSGSPTLQPSRQPTVQPTIQPTGQPTCTPSSQPTIQPTIQPTGQPSVQPSGAPTMKPSVQPSGQPSGQPSSQPSGQPSGRPTFQPSAQPSVQPTGQPSSQPSGQPSMMPSTQPTGRPSIQPTLQPTGQPSSYPSRKPSTQPTSLPSSRPSLQPTTRPSGQPSIQPSGSPSNRPSSKPSSQPTTQPSGQPSHQPSMQPTGQPTLQPTGQPSVQPTTTPTGQPTFQPTNQPTVQPTTNPSGYPTMQPSNQPTNQPSGQPSSVPSMKPTCQPSGQPSLQPTGQPSVQPTCQPSGQPSIIPTRQPTGAPTNHPSSKPTMQPSAQPTGQPSMTPTGQPSRKPSGQPSTQPSALPSAQPSSAPSCVPTSVPTIFPSETPTNLPTTTPSSDPTSIPSMVPSLVPSSVPSSNPTTIPTMSPSMNPSCVPTNMPSSLPTTVPSNNPTNVPTWVPTKLPSSVPSSNPTNVPSWSPTSVPTLSPSSLPSAQPTGKPSTIPSSQPTAAPSMQPSSQPTMEPSGQPSSVPTINPSSQPSSEPSAQPSSSPSGKPSLQPISKPTALPSSQPTMEPSSQPTSDPSTRPSSQPSSKPSVQPSSQPSMEPSGQPTSMPSMRPSAQPSMEPSGQPSSDPTMKPSRQPTSQPTIQPTSQPTMKPTCQPTGQPTVQPSNVPTGQPSVQPTGQPSVQPTSLPSMQPTVCPSLQPTSQPSVLPTSDPSTQPSASPTGQPSSQPTSTPSSKPSFQPTGQPSILPTGQPSVQPSSRPSSPPSSNPTMQPSGQPSSQPSSDPSAQPSTAPSGQPSSQPTKKPTCQPTTQPTGQPSVQPTGQPSIQPSARPSMVPSGQPSSLPTTPSGQPSTQPSSQPSIKPTGQPSVGPTAQPTTEPSSHPSTTPTGQPTTCPTSQPSSDPTVQPSGSPTFQPSSQPSAHPTRQPSSQPSSLPSEQPSGQPSVQPSGQPSGIPSMQPSGIPSSYPSSQPSSTPSFQPSAQPTSRPSCSPSSQPTVQPTSLPTMQPSRKPSSQPSRQPSAQPSCQPSSQPSSAPTSHPTEQPSSQPSMIPTGQPSAQPSRMPTKQPSVQPTSQPSVQPSTQPTMQPTVQPTGSPTTQPTVIPTGQPSIQPTTQPSTQPTTIPTAQPSVQPTRQPTVQPSTLPTGQPTTQPTVTPTGQPSIQPTGLPTRQPSSTPSGKPSCQPTLQPTVQPSRQPSGQPSTEPSSQPTADPSRQPTGQPSVQPTVQPTGQPSVQPSDQPTVHPTTQPSGSPSTQPSLQPSSKPSRQPTSQPSIQPSVQPTGCPSLQPTAQPSRQPSVQPTGQPSRIPTGQPTGDPSAQPSAQPFGSPTLQPTSRPTRQPTLQPTSHPSTQPSSQPSSEPSMQPTGQPSTSPSGQPSSKPTSQPSGQPSRQPSKQPTTTPSAQPSSAPTLVPTSVPTSVPSVVPSLSPTNIPTLVPSLIPTIVPSSNPTNIPTLAPSQVPTMVPTGQPTSNPTEQPTSQPSQQPSGQPSSEPTMQPSAQPTCKPSVQPTSDPSVQPSGQPTARPSRQPTSQPSCHPTMQPSGHPTLQPSAQPTGLPSMQPTSTPTGKPTVQPSATPTMQPIGVPTGQPSAQPSSLPSSQPSVVPTANPSAQPSTIPTMQPSTQPTMQPSSQPSSSPSKQPTSQPSMNPTSQPSSRPSMQPSSTPTMQPSRQPTGAPTMQPSCTPTRQPSAQPTGQPSCVPTSVPTAVPTRVPLTSSPTFNEDTNPPTSAPSAYPTINYNDYHSLRIYNDFQRLRDYYNNFPEVGLQFVYGSFNYKGKVVDGSCDEWNFFMTTAIKPPVDEIEIYAMTASFDYQNLDYALVDNDAAFSCSDETSVQKFVEYMLLKRSINIECEGNTWRVINCWYGTVFCINCDRVCNLCPGSLHPNYQTDPVTYDGNGGGVMMLSACFENCYEQVASYGILRFDTRRDLQFPEILNGPLLYVSTLESTSTYVNISKVGNVICGGVKSDNMLTNVFQIIQNAENNIVTYQAGSDTYMKVDITNLDPDTEYNIYCYTADYQGHAMDLEAVLATSMTVRTACCRQILFAQNEVDIYQIQQEGYQNSFQFSLNARSDATMTVSLSARTCESGVTVGIAFPIIQPSRFYFNGNVELKGTFRLDGSNSLGCFEIVGTVEGGPEYEDGYMIVNVRSSSYQKPEPSLINAKYSNDGRKYLMQFDHPTNRGGYESNPFPCAQQVLFFGGDQATCRWTTFTTLEATLMLPYDDSYIYAPTRTVPHYSVSLRPNSLKPICETFSECNGLPYSGTLNPLTAVKVNPPDKLPIVQSSLVLASTLLPCKDLVLDPTNSVGSFGREWVKVEYNFYINGTVRDEKLNSYSIETLPQNTRFPVTIPQYLFEHEKYSVDFKVTNIFGQSELVTKKFEVLLQIVAPDVQISFPSGNFIYRDQSLVVSTVARLESCDTTRVTRVEYVWAMYNDITFNDSLVSVSSNPKMFKLDPFSLDAGVKYRLMSRVIFKYILPGTEKVLEVKGESSVIFDVGFAGLAVHISGPNKLTLRISDRLFLDASSSHHIDYPDYKDLKFTWSCVETTPLYGKDCTIFAESMALSTLTASFATFNAYEKSYNFTVTVSDEFGNTGSSSVIVDLSLSNSLPLVRADKDAEVFNADSSIIIYGTVERAEGSIGSSSSTWSCEDCPSTFNMAASALTPIYMETSALSYSFPLTLAAESLSGGTYLFKLISTDTLTQSRGMTEIIVQVNDAPIGGTLSVTPNTGYALETRYEMFTYSWLDDNLPLSYAFWSYTVSIDKLTAVRPFTTSPKVRTYLAQGLERQGYEVMCLLEVMDTYGARSSVTTAIVVESVQHANVSEYKTTIDDLLEEALSSSDAELFNQVIAGATAAINAVECITPPCHLLNREACSIVPNTCGECLSGFVGVSGHSNTLCRETISADISGRRLYSLDEYHLINVKSSTSKDFLENIYRPDGSTCVFNSDCASYSCYRNVCQTVPKLCPKSCSGQGVCVARDINGEVLEICKSQNSYCSVKCECQSGSYGVDCSFTWDEINLLQDFRDELCDNLRTQISYSDMESDAMVESTVVSIGALTFDATQLNSSTALNCFSLLTDWIVENSETLPLSKDSTINSIAKVVSSAYNLPFGKLPLDFWYKIHHVLSLTVDAGLSNMVERQDPLSIITTHFRTILYTSLQDDNGMYKTLKAASGAFDAVYNISSPSVHIEGSSVTETTMASITEYNFNPYPRKYLSSIIETQITISSSRTHNDETIQLKIPNQDAVQYTGRNHSLGTEYCLQKMTPYNISVDCPGHTSYNLTCTGFDFHKYKYSCPSYETYPVCYHSNVYGQWERYACNATSYDSRSTDCKCVTVFLDSTRRLQALSPPSTLELGVKQEAQVIQFHTEFDRTDYPFEYQLIDQTLPDREPGVLVMVLAATFVFFVVVGLIVFFKIDFQRKFHEKRKNAFYSAKWYFEKALPIEFSHANIFDRFGQLLRRYDPLSSLFSDCSDDLTPSTSFRWSELCTRWLAIMLTVFIVMDLYQLDDDGTCESNVTINTCTLNRPFQDDRLITCVWDETTETCRYQQPNFTAHNFLYLVVVVSIMATPITSLVEYLFQNLMILSAVDPEPYDPLAKAKKRKERDKHAKHNKVHIAPDTEEDDLDDEHNDEPVGVKFDEFQAIATQKNLFLKGARLEKQRLEMDFVNADKEFKAMVAPFLSSNKDFKDSMIKKKQKERKTSSLINTSQSKMLSSTAFAAGKTRLTPEDYLLEERDPYVPVDQNRPDLEDRFWMCVDFISKNAKYFYGRFVKSYVSPVVDWISRFVTLQIVSYIQMGHPDNALKMMKYSASVSKSLAMSKLSQARQKSNSIGNSVNRRSEDSFKNVYMLQYFIVSCMKTEIYSFTKRIIFRSVGATSKFRYFYLQMCRITLVGICIPAIFVLASYYASFVGLKSYNLWCNLAVVSICFDTLFMNPLRIALVKLIMLVNIRYEVLRFTDDLSTRAKFIIGRTTGAMGTYSDLIHHFNPVCRAARTAPHLSISRLLISLRDADLTPSHCPFDDSVFRKIIGPVLFYIRYTLDYFMYMMPQYLYDVTQDLFAVALLNLSFYELCRGTSVWIGLVVSFLLTMYTQYVGRSKNSSTEVVEEEEERDEKIEDDPFMLMGIEPKIKKKKKEKLPWEFQKYYDFYVKKLHKLEEEIENIQNDDDSTVVSLALSKKKEYKGSKRKRIKEQRKEAIKEYQKKQEELQQQQQRDLHAQGAVEVVARMLQGDEDHMFPMADAKYPSPRSALSSFSRNQVDDSIGFNMDNMKSVTEEHSYNYSINKLSENSTSMQLKSGREMPESGPGITFGMNNPKKELRGKKRMHLISSFIEYIDEGEQNEGHLDAEAKPEMVFANMMDELEILEWVSIYKSSSTGRLPRIMQGPGYSRANRILRSKPRVKSRMKRYAPFPIMSESTKMTEAEATAIMNMNLIDQQQIEDEEKEHGIRPESFPPDDIDINRSIADSVMSPLHEGSASILGMDGAVSVAIRGSKPHHYRAEDFDDNGRYSSSRTRKKLSHHSKKKDIKEYHQHSRAS